MRPLQQHACSVFGRRHRQGRRPAGELLSRHDPAVFPGGGIHSQCEGIALAVDLHDRCAVDDPRARSHPHVVDASRMLDREVPLPEQPAGEIDGEQIARRIERDDPLPVAGGRARGHGARGMHERATSGPEPPVPDGATARLVERDNVKLILSGAARGRHDHEIPHDDRARCSPARQISFPCNSVGLAPAGANRLIGRRPTATRPEKLRPVGRRSCHAPEHHAHHHQQSSCRHDHSATFSCVGCVASGEPIESQIRS